MQILTTAECIGIIIAGLLTLMMYSFLYRDNVFYKFGEHLYVGISVGYFVNITYWQVFRPLFIIPAFYQREWILLIPFVLGMMLLSRFIRQISWVSRTPMAMLLGYGAGLGIPAILNANILKQVQTTIIQLWVDVPAEGGLSGLWWWDTFSIWLVFAAVLCVLFYFYFSIEHKGIVGKLGTIGIWFVMISFGAAFGYTVMARISLLIGRVQFLVDKVPEAFRTLINPPA